MPRLSIVLVVRRLDDLPDDDIKDPLLHFGDLDVFPLSDANFPGQGLMGGLAAVLLLLVPVDLVGELRQRQDEPRDGDRVVEPPGTRAAVAIASPLTDRPFQPPEAGND
jgi:hypothetical protein